MRFGYKLAAEAFGPEELIRQAVRAEDAGFDFVEIGDHYHPWLESQGHSPFAWSVLAAIAAKTERIELMTGVTCPTIRYHPAIIAQAAATTALLSGGRFVLGAGSGERLNEHVVGRDWPGAATRQEMLREALEIIRALWSGGYQSYEGTYLRIEDARVFDLPDPVPPIVVAGGGPSAARLAAEFGDGLMTTEPDPSLIEAYTGSGGDGPRYAEAPLAYAATEKEAAAEVLEKSRWALTGWPVMAELPNPVNFEAASATVREEDVLGQFACGPDVERHLETIKQFTDAGYDHIVTQNAGPDPDGFIDFFAAELRPRLD